MTVLYGVIGWNGRTFDSRAVQGMSDCLEPFGDEDTWVGAVGGLSASIACRGRDRRSPALSRQGQQGVLVLADARLSRRAELARELSIPTSSTDPELVASAYATWGCDLTDHISGEFSAVIIDVRQGRVLILRDHAGRRPLALYEGADMLAFASTELALTGAPDVGHELDEQRAVEVLLNAYATGRTFVRGVRTVPAGTTIRVDGGGTSKRRWWEGRFEIHDEGSIGAHASLMRDQFDRAVISALDGAQLPGVLLSGGLDSSSVAAVAAQMRSPNEVRSYTLVPPRNWTGPPLVGWKQSERTEVEAMAARFPNLRPSYVTSRRQALFADEAWWELGCPPFRNPVTSKALVDCFRDASADGVDVLMWGAAGNMAFSAGGDKWLAELARHGRLVALAREARAWSTVNKMPLPYVLRHHFLRRLFPRLAEWRARRLGGGIRVDILLAGAVSPERLAEIDVEAIIDSIFRPGRHDWTRDLGGVFLGETGNAELGLALRPLFRLELLDPTVDRHLLEVAATQPDWWRNHNGEWRAIGRAAMRDTLPPEIVERVSLGEQLPEYLDILTEGRAQLESELEEMRDHPASVDTLDVARLERLVAAWPDRDQRNSERIMYEYREAVPKAIGVSRYMRWFEQRGQRIGAGGPAVILHDPFADFV